MNLKMLFLGLFLENPAYTIKTPTRIVVLNKGFGGDRFFPQYLVTEKGGNTSWRNFRERISFGFMDEEFDDLKKAQEYLSNMDKSLRPTWDVVETNWK